MILTTTKNRLVVNKESRDRYCRQNVISVAISSLYIGMLEFQTETHG